MLTLKVENMKIEELKTYKKILIVGYGIEGKTTEKFLKKYHPDAEIGIADEKDGEGYLDVQSEYDLAVRAPGVRKELIAIPYTTATNIFFANLGAQKTIGITGSKGKSTTAALVRHIFKTDEQQVELLGNIGTPMLEYFLSDRDDNDILVIELSSYQLDDIQFSPHIACFLNIYADHVKYHGNVKNYVQAKSTITKFSKPNDYFIYNGNFPEISEIAKSTYAQTIDFSRNSIALSVRSRMTVSEESVQAAHAITSLFTVSDTLFTSAVQSFSGLPHRLQAIGTYKDIIFINDSAATTPESAVFALDHIQNIGSVILGGLDRGNDFTDLAKKVAEKKIKTIILFSDADKRLDKALKESGVEQAIVCHADDMQEAVSLCYDHTEKGSICLLSPGCASYNQYANFPQRGDMFKKAVVDLSA